MRAFRKIVFWLHLACGVTGGVVIFIMCVTGALLAFEKNVVEYAEGEARYVAYSEIGRRLSVAEILAKIRLAKPGLKPSTITVPDAPDAAVAVALGRDGQVFVDPYTGENTGEAASGVRAFFRATTDLHRWLAFSGEGRPVGKAINDACNLMFLILAISGIYIWTPRMIEWRRVKPNLWFRRGLKGKGRDFNWHNVIGFWLSLVLMVLTLTAVVISYQWAGDLVYTLTGSEPPPRQVQPQAPLDDQRSVVPENLDAIWARAEGHVDDRKSISLRFPIGKEAVFTIDEGRSWNIFGRSTLAIDPLTLEVTRWEPYAEQNYGRQLRSWIRFTHTGESGGIIGQFIAFMACIGGAFLVYTGLSLAVRRFARYSRRARS